MIDNLIDDVNHVPRTKDRVVSSYQPEGYNNAATILSAAAVMSAEDVLLLKTQEYDPVSGSYYWPLSIVNANYDAIRLATALGITVMKAGCNGDYDLDTYVNLNGKRIFHRSSPDFRDPLSIMVGAGTSATPHARMSYSNHGSRIDLYAWGENIDTASTNDAGTDNRAYTTSFGGTSGASPIIVGAALTIQGIASAATKPKYSPLALRSLLSRHGTPSMNPVSDRIGVMPNLKEIIPYAFSYLKYWMLWLGSIRTTIWQKLKGLKGKEMRFENTLFVPNIRHYLTNFKTASNRWQNCRENQKNVPSVLLHCEWINISQYQGILIFFRRQILAAFLSRRRSCRYSSFKNVPNTIVLSSIFIDYSLHNESQTTECVNLFVESHQQNIATIKARVQLCSSRRAPA